MKLKHITKKPEGFADFEETTPQIIEGTLQRTFIKTPWTIEKARTALLEKATERRWNEETGGMALPDGTQLHTTLADQNRITTVIANARLAGVTYVDFKAKSGWIYITIEQLESISGAIALHVQQCFSAERFHHNAITQLTTLEEIENYDLNQWWPTYD